jgi:predicted nucleotidyltransferase
MADARPVIMTDAERSIVLDILRAQLPGVDVWAFGSRVAGTPKPWSDLDLALISDGPIGISRMASLRDAFSESDLPWKVDLVDWSVTTPEFRELIARHYAVLLGKGG